MEEATQAGSMAEAVLTADGFKRKFSLGELYRAAERLPDALPKLVKNRKSGLLDGKFVERLQLAVTEVNGCAACSYQHTQMALKQGMSNEEIRSFLSGDSAFVVTDEAKAILFAQHFADSRGNFDPAVFAPIVEEYGEQKAGVILAACRMMIVGNMYGIPFSAFLSRLKGKKYQGSTLGYELGMLIGGLVLLPIALIHGLFRRK